jgi:hypothetical protein
MRSARSLALLGASAALLAAAPAARADAPRVGLVVATRVNMADSEADALASRLGDALRDQLLVDVIAGAETRRRLPPAGLADDCVARPACVRDVATRLDRDELLFLFMVRIGPRLQIDVTWADPRRGSITSRPALVVEGQGGKPADSGAIGRAFRAAPRSLLPAAARRPRPRPAPAPVAEPAAVGGAASTSVEIGGPGEPSAAPADAEVTDMPVPQDAMLSRGHGRRLTTPVVVFGAISAAALATGVGFAVAARQDYSALEDDGCDLMPCPGADDRVDQLEQRALVADFLFAGAGAAAVTGLIFYLTSDDDPPVRVGASAGGDSAVLSLGGRF